MHRYKCWNGPMPTTSYQQIVSTGTVTKTMLQIATPSTRQLTLLAWGFHIDTGADGVIELLQTGSIAATVTAHVANGLPAMDPNAPTSLMSLGVNATGYTATAEGAIVATRVFDVYETDLTVKNIFYEKVFTPAERPIVGSSQFLRIRCSMGTSVGMRCWIAWDE